MSNRARKGRARREAILSLVVPAEVIVDVGCGHGRVAAAVGSIGTERHWHLLPRHLGVPLVVADGLRPFRRVDLAIIAGLGSLSILRILAQGPRPRMAILHSPERTTCLRQGLADAGFRIDAERLAPEGRRFAEVIRIVPGRETASEHRLWFGPKLLGDPLLLPHTLRVHSHWQHVLRNAPPDSPSAEQARGWLDFLNGVLRTRCGV